jgi:thiol-disulfide isomerase/thioredoxin
MKLLLGLGIFAAGLMAQVAPKLTSLDQVSYRKLIAAHHGKVIVANFWATWCLPCRKEMPQLVQLSRKLAARGFDLVMISADDPEQEAAALKLLKDNRAEGTAYLLKTANKDAFYPTVDGKWASGELPAVFLYDRNGQRVRSFFGEASISDLEAAITKLL